MAGLVEDIKQCPNFVKCAVYVCEMVPSVEISPYLR